MSFLSTVSGLFIYKQSAVQGSVGFDADTVPQPLEPLVAVAKSSSAARVEAALAARQNATAQEAMAWMDVKEDNSDRAWQEWHRAVAALTQQVARV
jgi:hypothetical protein